MFTRTFDPRQFLRSVFGTEPFRTYCEQRGIAFEQAPGLTPGRDNYARWLAALAVLPGPVQARVELELAQVNEVAEKNALRQLTEAAVGLALPPDSIPAGAPQALWFLLHHPGLFQEVFLGHEIAEVDAWRAARAPAGIAIDDLPGKEAALAGSLKDFYRLSEGTGRFCAVESHVLGDAVCFVGYVSGRVQLLTVFTDDGRQVTHAARPALPVIFVYYPSDGRLLLKARLRSRDRILDLLRRFGWAVLGGELGDDCLLPSFRLDILKQRFDPLPDAGDIEMVRVKTLHLGYPGRSGRRRVKLETLATDDQFAILELLRAHGGKEAVLNELRVLYAELQVRLRVEGGNRNVSIRLWRDRCNLNQTPLDERFVVCLRRWGIAHAP